MKKTKTRPAPDRRQPPATLTTPQRPRTGIRAWHVLAGAAAVLAAVFAIYGPALNGPFVFDDRYLPFMNPNDADAPLRSWLGVRPLLMFTYWVNYKISGLEPYSYHVVNAIFHALNSVLMFFVIRRLLELAGETGARRDCLAGIAAIIFLAHPVQTEAVAYIASRSEVISVFFVLSGFAVFLYARPEGLGFGRAVAVLFLLGAGIASKEHAMAVPAVLLLTDLFWRRLEGVRRNWPLYAMLGVAVAAGGVAILNILRTSPVIGFKLQDLSWYQYLFSQFRMVWTYIRLYMLPVGLSIDYDVPVSRTIVDHGALFGLIALMAAVVLAWIYRRKYPLACYGLLVFLILLAPTSSIVPIRDLIADRRLYLPMIGLLLITLEFLRRLRWDTVRYGFLAVALLVVLGGAAWARNRVWGDEIALWQDTVEKSPRKYRPRFQLAFAHYQKGRCSDAAREFDAASKVMAKPEADLYVDWGLALECAGRVDEAIVKLRRAAEIEKSGTVLANLAMVLGKHHRHEEAKQVLDMAQSVAPGFSMIYVYRGHLLQESGDLTGAIEQYETAARLNPSNVMARDALAQARQRLGGTRR
jgi:tetratricopeptide (TPR) repeat protein